MPVLCEHGHAVAADVDTDGRDGQSNRRVTLC